MPAKVSAVNVGEVAAKLRDIGMPDATVETVLGGLQTDVRAHGWQAALAAAFSSPGDARGRSVARGSRLPGACRPFGAPAMTADRSWERVAEAVGVRVIPIR